MNALQISSERDQLIQISMALSVETNTKLVLEMILKSAQNLTHADGGSLYRIDGEGIIMELMHSDSLGIQLGGASNQPLNLPDIPIFSPDGTPNQKNVVSHCFHSNTTVNIEDAYDCQDYDFSGTKAFDEKNDYRSKSFLAVPMKNHQGTIIGILQLINAIDPHTQTITSFSIADQQIVEALASQAASVLTKQTLIDDLEAMFESLVKLIATAIDDKSPHTGGHCRRVPELTMMLAEAAHNTRKGYLKDFTMTAADRHELTIAGWLHDCGKIATPEYILDKSTKLECLFDRITLIETRFEVLKRDQEIAWLKKKLAATGQGEQFDQGLDAYYANNLAKLTEELDFIKQANTGSEFMTVADQERIRQLKNIAWSCNGKPTPWLTDNEIENLTVAKGTFTASERDIINRHIDTTIAMLSQIKFPKHLERVPEYAGGHHEKMDGTGYPKQLTREQTSIPARAMAIADIFEALTAKDRPYKEGKKLSEALAILKKMKDEQHIDPDLYDAFIEQKVYLQYAEKFLDPSQIDLD